MIKAFVIAKNGKEYQQFIRINGLKNYELPYLAQNMDLYGITDGAQIIALNGYREHKKISAIDFAAIVKNKHITLIEEVDLCLI